jgi:putative aldouronate transport system permease protein
VVVKGSLNDRIFDAVNFAGTTLFSLVVLYPLLYVVSASFSSPAAVVAGRVWLLPVEPTFRAYAEIFKSSTILLGYRNSLIYMVTGTTVNVILTVCAAYPLARRDLFGKNVIMVFFVFTMLFNGGLIPYFLVVKRLGMLDTFWAMIIPNALSVYYVLIARTFFLSSFPDELLEAVKIEGASDFRFVWSFVIPLSGPIIAVLGLFYALGHWNSYFHALIFMSSMRKFPLQILLKNILVDATTDFKGAYDFQDVIKREELRVLLRYALIVVASLPVLIIYPFVQRFFVKGVMIGSIKG